MNSEELEVSLRTEFEIYLKNVLAEMRQEATEFQTRIEAEFDKHKTQFDEAFKSFSERFDSDRTFDEAFSSTVAEHLRLARDEGARIAANAMDEAEKLEQESAPVPEAPPAPAHYDLIRDAVNDISGKDSQSAILRSLVEHAGQFAPRGAFFIIKSEHFVGWKVFGDDADSAESAIRDIHFPMSDDSILASAVQAQTTVGASAGDHQANSAILSPLEFGEPDRMYAIPLIARGRGVAVLYADHGNGSGDVNRDALETLVRVAGLTVELLATTQLARTDDSSASADFENAQHEGFEETPPPAYQPQFEETEAPAPAFDESTVDFSTAEPGLEESAPASDFAFTESTPFDTGFDNVSPFASESDDLTPVEDPFGVSEPAVEYQEPAVDTSYGDIQSPTFDQADGGSDTVHEVTEAEAPVTFDSGGSIEQASPFDQPVGEYEPAASVSSGGYNQVVEPVVEVAATPVPQARLSDRHVDLPIEVPDDERRIHNDARRFARLLVSEIKLYNEKKVTEGREARDLYERLREAIDRSREMYDKRVQPPVAAKFDYFHYEIVNALAEGDVDRLGSNYPGSTI